MGSGEERAVRRTHQSEEGNVQTVDEGHHTRSVRASLLEDAIVEDVLEEIEEVVHDREALEWDRKNATTMDSENSSSEYTYSKRMTSSE